MTYDQLLMMTDNEQLIVKEQPLISNNGRIENNRIAIRKNIPTVTEKACVLAEELGHYYTSAGSILDQSHTFNRQQEFRARMWAYNLQIGLNGLVNAFNAGCKNCYEIAEYLEVTEEFLYDAITSYRSKYGVYTQIREYVIYFIPNLNILKIY